MKWLTLCKAIALLYLATMTFTSVAAEAGFFIKPPAREEGNLVRLIEKGRFSETAGQQGQNADFGCDFRS